MSDSDAKVSPYGVVLVGPARSDADLALIIAQNAAPAVAVEMAILSEKNSYGLYDVLLQISGLPAHQAGIDKKVLRYQTVPAGTGQNFNYRSNGQERTRMISRQSWGNWQMLQLFLDGQTIDLRHDTRRSQDARPLHLWTAYSQMLTSSPSRLETERALVKTKDDLQTAGLSIKTFAVEWNGFESNEMGRRCVHAIVTALKPSLTAMLGDEMGKQALSSIAKLTLAANESGDVTAEKNGNDIKLWIGVNSGVDQDSSGSDGVSELVTTLFESVL